MKNVLKVVFVIIGALVGAGFASGQEVNIFFFSHGMKGMFGIIISSILMGFIIYYSLKLICKNNITNYKEFLDILLKSKSNLSNILKMIISTVINTFILITFFIMIAGFGAYFDQEFGINSLIGSTLLAIICFIILMKNVEGVVKSSEVLVPCLIIFLLIIGFLNIKEIKLLEISKYIIETSESNWILDAILYCSYNSILLIPVIITLRNYIKNNKQIILVSILTTIITIILAMTVFLILSRIDVDINNLEMPVVYVVSKMFKIFEIIYGFIILASIFTTSVSLGMSFLQNITSNKKRYPQILIIMCITAILVSKIGFSNLVNYLYPIFGYLGIIQIIRMLAVHT